MNSKMVKYLFDALFIEDDDGQIAYKKFIYISNDEHDIEFLFDLNYNFIQAFSKGGVQPYGKLIGGWRTEVVNGRPQNSETYELYFSNTGKKCDIPDMIREPIWNDGNTETLWSKISDYDNITNEIEISMDGSWKFDENAEKGTWEYWEND